MKTNTSLTRFKKTISDHSEVWQRILIRKAFWRKKTKVAVTKDGLLRANNVVVYIPFSQADEAPAIGDILIKGTVELEIEGNTTPTVLTDMYPENMTVSSVDPQDYGSVGMRHWQVEGG